MGLTDWFRGKGRGVLGIELGQTVAAAQVAGEPPVVKASGQSGHAGLSGSQMGDWLRGWLDAIDGDAKSAHAVIVDEEVYHYLVTMPEMSASERHLAAGAEVRKLAPVPAGQLAYSHVSVGMVDEGGAAKERVLISAVGNTAVDRATGALEAAGLDADIVTTVPSALIRANDYLPPAAGGTAIAYLAAGRSYLLVFEDGVLELVRDFVLRSDDRDFDPQAMTELITAELRRSFLYFGQRAQGATVDRLVLTGPMANLTDVAARLREGLGITVELFDASSQLDLGATDHFDQPAVAVALGAATMRGREGGSLIAPEATTERRTQRAMSSGLWVAAVVLVGLGLWALWAFISGTMHQSRLDDANGRIAARQTELQGAQARQQERSSHVVRAQLLEQRSLESTLLGAVLQRVGQRIPEQLTLDNIRMEPVTGTDGTTYWDVDLSGIVFGASRSESQAVFSRFYALLESDPIVESAHITDSLRVGDASARRQNFFAGADQRASARRTTAARAGGYADRLVATENWARVGRNPWMINRPNFGRGLRPGLTAGGATAAGRADATASDAPRTTLDDLAPFEPTATSVNFNVRLQLKGIASGANR